MTVDKINKKIGTIVLIFITGTVYLYNQVKTIYGGDGGDLVSAIATFGIPHPPGYPLYTFIGVVLKTIIPVGTLAWKIAFLSSVPGILTVIFLYKILKLLTGKTFIPLIITLTYAFVYPIWLYSEVVEVFSLNNLFIVLLLYFALLFNRSGEIKHIFIVSFIFGLSFTHHHIIVFLLPVLLILVFKKVRRISRKNVFFCFLIFISGFFPYLYLFFSAYLNPGVNWQGGADLSSFMTLVMRKDYGTFLSSPGLVRDPSGRLMEIWAFLRFYYQDFRFLGIILAVLGFYNLWRKEKFILNITIIGILLFIFFLYYASFPLSDNFGVGTFERFITPLYIFLTIPLSFGLIQLNCIISQFIVRILPLKKKKRLMAIITVLFLVYPISIFCLNYPKISILKNDFTAEYLGMDILNSVDKNSILLLMNDTPIFDTQYVYYTSRNYRGIKLIHFSKLFTPYYDNQLKKYYPDVIGSYGKDKGSGEIIKDFLEFNYPKHQIFSKLSLSDAKGKWVPWGLVFRYYQDKDLPGKKEILRVNENLWSQFHDPLDGSLAKYRNLMLSDILRIYSVARQEIAVWEIKNGYFNEAINHLIEAKKLTPGDKDVYLLTATAKLKLKLCQEVTDILSEVEKIDKENPDLYYLHAVNFGECINDKDKSAKYEKLYLEKIKGKEVPLKNI